MPKTLFDKDVINNNIEKVARSIITDYEDKKPLFVALLRGAAPFASKLMFAISRLSPDFHPEIDYMMVSTYGSTRTAGMPEVVTDLAPTTVVENRIVIVLDDVLDKGVTADFVMNLMRDRGANDVKLAVLVDKQTERLKPIEADYLCLSSPDVWLVGMGMDDGSIAESYRWRGDILEIN